MYIKYNIRAAHETSSYPYTFMAYKGFPKRGEPGRFNLEKWSCE